MDMPLLAAAAVAGALVSLSLSSIALGVTERLGASAIVAISVAAIALALWLGIDWAHVDTGKLTALLPTAGKLAGASLVGAVVGAILPLILSAIGGSMRGDEI